MDPKIKRLRWGLCITLVLVSASLGFGKIRLLLSSWEHDPADRMPMLVAQRYIQAYSMIQPKDVRVVDIPKAWFPPGALSSLSELQNELGQKLSAAAVAVPEGHPLTRALLIDTSRSDALGALLGPGRVAVSFEIDRAHGVGGWIKPGDSVGILAGSGGKLRLLFPSILVLAVDRERLGERQEKKSEDAMGILPQEAWSDGESKVITVLATAREATTLIEARDTGSLSVVLRSPGDDIPWPEQK